MKKLFLLPTAFLALLCIVACGGGASVPGGDPGPIVTSVTSVSIAPTSATVIAGQTQQFTATVIGKGNFSKTVQWTVNDLAGGSATTGTIASGLYTAPEQLPNPSTVTVKAVSKADSSKSASVQVTIAVQQAPRIVWPETDLSISGNDGEASEMPPGVAVVEDGADGAFVLWEHQFPIGIWVQHLNAAGQPVWAAGGIPVTSPWTDWQASPRAVADGSGGVIVVWVDGRAGWCGPSFMAECNVYGQRLDSSGNLMWGAAGKPITTAAGNQGLGELRAIEDGTGGAFIAYSDGRIGTTSQGGSGGRTLYVQHVNGSGDPVWSGDGIRIGQDPQAGDAGTIFNVKLLSDGSGGVLAAWYFTSYAGSATVSVRVQRISPSGQIQWSSGGVVTPGVSATDSNGGAQTLDAVSDGEGDLIIVTPWTQPNALVPSISAQRVDTGGNIRWSTTGVHVSTLSAIAMNPSAMSDGQGGAYFSWQDCSNSGECDLSMARVNGSGELTWGARFIAQLAGQQFAPVVVPNSSGGALVMWTDCRAYGDANSCYFNSDIYAQNVSATGSVLYKVNGAPLSTSAGNQGQQYFVYTPMPAMVWTRLQSGDIVMAWPDGRNGQCFQSWPDSVCELYVERFKP